MTPLTISLTILSIPPIRYIRIDFWANLLTAVIGILFLALMVVSNIDARRRLDDRRDILTVIQIRRRVLNIRLRWAAVYFFFGAEAFALYRAWGQWHYSWADLPLEVVFFDLFRLSGFIVLMIFWVLDAKG